MLYSTSETNLTGIFGTHESANTLLSRQINQAFHLKLSVHVKGNSSGR